MSEASLDKISTFAEDMLRSQVSQDPPKFLFVDASSLPDLQNMHPFGLFEKYIRNFESNRHIQTSQLVSLATERL
jgi:hypothetical protein